MLILYRPHMVLGSKIRFCKLVKTQDEPNIWLFRAGKSECEAFSGGLHIHLPQKDIEKSEFNRAKSERKKTIATILFLYYELLLLLNYNKVLVMCPSRAGSSQGSS